MPTDIPDFTTRLLIDAGIEQGMRILDVGCGSGDVSFLLLDLTGGNAEIIGVDRDAGAIANARQRSAAQDRPELTFLQCDLLGAEDVDIETLQPRLDEERSGSQGVYIGDVMFGSWARKI